MHAFSYPFIHGSRFNTFTILKKASSLGSISQNSVDKKITFSINAMLSKCCLVYLDFSSLGTKIGIKSFEFEKDKYY